MVWANLKDILLLLVGAGISLFTTLIDSKRTRKWMLEDRMRERANAAVEVRLKEAEEIIKTMSADAYYFNRMVGRILNANRLNDLKDLNEVADERETMLKVLDKGFVIYSSSIMSLQDEALEEAWKEVRDNSLAYEILFRKLENIIFKTGKIFSPENKEKYANENKLIKDKYFKSVEKCLHRINELRSQ